MSALKNFPFVPFFFLNLLIIIIFGCVSKTRDSQKYSRELIIFHAGSLSVPVQQICDSFSVKHPNVVIKPEAAGSVASARKITDLNRNCDVFLSADQAVIDKFLIPDFAEWSIGFATNEMTIVFTENSKFSDQINSNNWPEILLKDDVCFGRSDPNSDPCGYRTVISLELSGKMKKNSNFTQLFLQKDNRFIRPKEVDLIALLETQIVDYVFLYRSVAIQHKLKYLALPDSINLGNPNLKIWYETASVEINGKQPGENIIQKGESMIYGVTIPENALNPDLAIVFVEFLLDANQGMKIMETNGQPSVIPTFSTGYTKIPASLQKYTKPIH
jgi:molybdate/tungstate transport system substrate-binding protein